MQLGWIDFSQEDRKKVLDVINLLQEPGAVDEIGIGLIRDAFANLFFPGTSTVQTIAKYFLIVPYILKEATEGRYGNDLGHILRRIDQEEKVCGIRLMQNCPGEDGIIGRRFAKRLGCAEAVRYLLERHSHIRYLYAGSDNPGSFESFSCAEGPTASSWHWKSGRRGDRRKG